MTVAHDGQIWALNEDKLDIMKYSSTSNQWESQSADFTVLSYEKVPLRRIVIDPAGNPWVNDAFGRLFR